MGKNKGKGGSSRKKGSRSARAEGAEKRELVLKEAGQEYARVTRMLGGSRLEAYCFDGKVRQARICGRMRGRAYVRAGEVVLISTRDFEDEKADVIGKYSMDEARKLVDLGQIPESAMVATADEAAEGHDGRPVAGFDFVMAESGDESSDDSSSEDEESESEKAAEAAPSTRASGGSALHASAARGGGTVKGAALGARRPRGAAKAGGDDSDGEIDFSTI